MYLVETKKIRVLKPRESKFLANKEKTEVYEGFVYLSKSDNPNNYVEVDENEKNEILKKQEEERKREEFERKILS